MCGRDPERRPTAEQLIHDPLLLAIDPYTFSFAEFLAAAKKNRIKAAQQSADESPSSDSFDSSDEYDSDESDDLYIDDEPSSGNSQE